MSTEALRILVLAGGPDAEREVSLKSGAAVTAALSRAGHTVRQRDITPDDTTALAVFEAWPGDVIFPVLHGPWGEGGGLQRLLEARGLAYVGSGAEAASLCMDKHRSKQALLEAGLPTPRFALMKRDQVADPPLPLVVKPAREGSSVALSICHDEAELAQAWARAREHDEKVLAEQYVSGREITVGVLAEAGERQPPTPSAGLTTLPPIEIVPATAYYDYEAKYHRDDTRYRFDMDLAQPVLDRLREIALAAHRVLGARHLSRVDFIVDADQQPWVLEVNTLPGFTDHSLLPKAAAEAGLSMEPLCDRLARLGVGREA